MLNFLRDSAKVPLTRQGPPKSQTAEAETPITPYKSSILQHFKVEPAAARTPSKVAASNPDTTKLHGLNDSQANATSISGGLSTMKEDVFTALSHEEKVARNNLFVESRAMVQMVMREWRSLLSKYKERHPERFAYEGGYCRPNRYSLLSATSAAGLPDDISRPSTSVPDLRPLSSTSSRRIGFANDETILGDATPIKDDPLSACDDSQPSNRHQNKNILDNNHRSGSARSNRSQFVMVNTSTGMYSASTYDPKSGYRAPANLRERTTYICKSTVQRPLETFTADDIDRDYNLRAFLNNPEGYVAKKCSDKEYFINEAQYEDDEEPMIDPEAEGNNDSDREDYELCEAEMLKRDILFGDKHARASRKQGDWDLFELRARELRRKLAEEEADINAAEASQSVEGDINSLVTMANNEETLDALTLTPLQLRAKAIAAALSAPHDLPDDEYNRPTSAGWYASTSTAHRVPQRSATSTTGSLSGNPARALARLRIPSRKYYNRLAKRTSREAEERLAKAIEGLEADAHQENETIRDSEISHRKALEALAFERSLLTQERIRQLEWDRQLGSQQNVIASEEMFLRATYWQEERATRYNVYHWFDDTFEEEIERIRLRIIEDEKEVNRKMDHRKELEDEEAKKEYERLCRRNQKIAHLQNQRVVQLRRNRIERERLMNLEFAERQFILREEIDVFHSPNNFVFADSTVGDVSLDEFRIAYLYPAALDALVAEYHTQKAILTKELSRGTPYDIRSAVGEERQSLFNKHEKEQTSRANGSAKRYRDTVYPDEIEFDATETQKKENNNNVGQQDTDTADPLQIENQIKNDASVNLPSQEVLPESELDTLAADTIPSSQQVDPDDNVTSAAKASAVDKANYEQFLQLVDEKLPLAVMKEGSP